MSTANVIELSWLLPKFSEITFFPNNAEQLSTLFVALLLAIFTLFSLKFLYHFITTQMNLRWLISELKGLTRDNFAEERTKLYQKAIQKRHKPIGHLWLEFDETLVEVRQADQVTVRNTLDAGHFFNNHNLAKEVTENRLIAAVPGFLTAVGVIGTFVGLQIGLSELQLGADTSIEVMKGGIAGVVNGAKVAFLTSVWGVALSVIFNFGEKFFEQRVRNRIRFIEDQVDKIFPRVRAEDQLQAIAESSEESRETLQGLAEQIGIKMQEAVVIATQGIQSSLEQSLTNIMAPAINKLVDETSEGNQKVLEELVNRFIEGIGSEGAQQRQALDDVSAKVNDSILNMENTMQEFVTNLQRAQADSGEREKTLIADISNQVTNLTSQTEGIQRTLTEFVEKQVAGMTAQVEAREKSSAEREQELVKAIKEQVSELVRNSHSQGEILTSFVKTQLDSIQTSFNEREQRTAEVETVRNQKIEEQSVAISKLSNDLLISVDKSINEHVRASKSLLEQGEALQGSINASTEAGARAATALRESATELRVSADNIKIVSSHMSDAGTKLSGTISNAVKSTNDLAEQNQASSKQIEKLRDELNADILKFSTLAAKLDEMLQTAGSTFTELKATHREFIQDLGQQVDSLTKRMSSSLEDYASRANTQTADHLKVWSDSVTQYSTQMNSAVKALGNVVDSIETQLAK